MPASIPFPALSHVLRIDAVHELWQRARSQPGASIHRRVLEELEIEPRWSGSADAIPAAGPLVVVANHPFGLLEGPLVGALLEQVRNDVRFVANSLLSQLPGLGELIFDVDPFGAAQRENAGPLRRALAHLQSGGTVVVFPAGEVSALRAPLGRIADTNWNPMAARLAIRTGAKILPIYLHGGNRARFQVAGLIHPRLRTLLLPSEFLAWRRHRVHGVIGDPTVAGRYEDPASLTARLRAKVYSLAPRVRFEVLARPRPEESVAANVAGLSPVLESGPYQVFLEPSNRIPEILPEIGRLREETFRAAGEGTGRAFDVDRFDALYSHLFLWHRDDRKIAGAYRLAAGAAAGSYTSTLFRTPRGWDAVLSAGVELGRSFVCRPYQKGFLPLLLLWKGIGHYVGLRRDTRFLFGPVSVSANYSQPSRAAIVSHFGPARAGFHPRNPMTYAMRWTPQPRRTRDELEAYLRRENGENMGLPVLLRQYLQLGGEVLCWNLDAEFSNSLDGLLLLDLRNVPEPLLRRYFGRDALHREPGTGEHGSLSGMDRWQDARH